MRGTTHIYFSIATNVRILPHYYTQNLTLEENALFVLGATIGAVLPDIDKLGTTANHILPKPLQYAFATIFTHRKQTHRIYVFVFLWWLLNYRNVSMLFAYPFLIGYGTHLLGDCLTKSGLALFEFFGLFKKNFRFYIIRHEYIELLIQYLCLILIVMR